MCNCFFINGPGGTGRTFLYNALLATIRLHEDIILVVVASSRISVPLIDKVEKSI
ncbi:hypothetical protein C1645_832305 [Glomus cerebriforme]|uniref:ATP-dependent DNA helicase n=1 Tax=Glomus cerebriforme TaxID=658196 RepID=A0A397SFT9_9GLOM|nr:hypothetical protein C1645_832305 [Glomus cerebriforme]